MYGAILDDVAFERIRAFVYHRSRIRLGDNKRNLVQARLSKRLRVTGHPTYGSYIQFVTGSEAGQDEVTHLLDAISTNKTSFFREPAHFTYLAQAVLPALQQHKGYRARPRLRVWSAACSTGEEPYSIAITLCEAVPDLVRWDAKILATDINSRVLAAARAARYSQDAVAAVPPRARQAHLERIPGGTGNGAYRVSAAVRKLVAVRRLNLMAPQFPFRGPFDVIFCRNVMIYFDKETQADLVQRLAHVLEPDGYLFVGHSESLLGANPAFRYVQPTIYQRIP